MSARFQVRPSTLEFRLVLYLQGKRQYDEGGHVEQRHPACDPIQARPEHHEYTIYYLGGDRLQREQRSWGEGTQHEATELVKISTVASNAQDSSPVLVLVP